MISGNSRGGERTKRTITGIKSQGTNHPEGVYPETGRELPVEPSRYKAEASIVPRGCVGGDDAKPVRTANGLLVGR